MQSERFDDLAAFQPFIQAHHHLWPQEVQQALRLIALNGIIDPISRTRLPATSLRLDGDNYRETLEHKGLVARHRAVLLCLQELMAAGGLPPQEQIDLYCPEAVTPFAGFLHRLFPRSMGSEYLPDPADPRRAQLPHQDLCALSLADACVDVVLCNELFEHLYDLPAALAEIARILRAGGCMIATCPMAYNRYDSIIKARHKPGATPGVAAEAELLTEPEFHGNPVAPEHGSLVYQIPGWELLDQARAAGLTDVHLRWLAAPSYGVVGQEIPAVIVMVARR
ncbi:MAG: methyltransferase domain-containing protein [Synechococcus sp. ELA057]